MRIWSADKENPRRELHLRYYFGAMVAGVLLFFIFLLIFKGFTFLIIYGIKYWIFILVAIGGLLVLKKIFGRKKVVMVKE